MSKTKRPKTVKLGLILLICTVLSGFLMTGCASWKKNVPNLGSDKPNMNLQLPVNNTTLLRYKIAWLPSAGIVAASLAIGAMLLGARRLGMAVLGTSIAGIFFSVTLSTYANWIALAGLVSAVILLVAMILKVKKSNVSLVKGIQNIKSEFKEMKPHVNRVVTEVQDSDVIREVKRIKRQLAVKAAYLKEKS